MIEENGLKLKRQTSIYNFTSFYLRIVLLKDRDRRGRDRMVVGFIYNYLCSKCLSPITLWVRITLSGEY